ncbi:MAG: carbohydrate-binding family 9-like protein, partial [Armatimonadota bacterium]
MMRISTTLILALMVCISASWAVQVEKSDEAIALSNDLCSVEVDLAKGSAPIRARAAGSEEPLLQATHMSMYFSENEHWVSETWIRPGAVETADADGGQSVVTDSKNFGGFALRRTVTLIDDSPVVQVRYHLVAEKETRPQLIVPMNIHAGPEADRVATPGGAMDAGDIEVSNFAIELKSKWYAFQSSVTGRGLIVAPIITSDLHTKPYIQHREDDSLGLAWRIHPMKSYTEGEDFSFAYNIALFEGDCAAAAQSVVQAGAGPINELPTPEPESTDGEAGWLPVAYCPEASSAPGVDGHIDEACWTNDGEFDRFQTVKGDAYPKADTTARAVLHGDTLYLAIRCEEPNMSDLQTNAPPGSNQVWTDDAVEVFIDADGDGKEYAHLIVNAAGVQQDNLMAERGVQYQWAAETVRGDDFWNAEISIPLSDLGVERPGAGETWRFNICRSRHPVRELSCWSPTMQGFHRPEYFGCLVFGDPAVLISGVKTGLQSKEDERSLNLRIDPSTAKGQQANVDLAVLREGQQTDQGAYQGAVTADLAEVRVPYAIDTPGPYVLDVDVSASGAPVMQASFAGTVYSQGLASAVYPAEEDGNSLFIAKGTAQHVFFVPANHSDKDYEEFDFVLLLPEGIDVYDGVGGHLDLYYNATLQETSTVERDGHTMTRWVWRSSKSMGKRDIAKTRFYRSWLPVLTVDEDLAPGSYPWYFYIQSGEDREHEHRGDLTILPPLQGRQPEHLTIGMACWTIDPNFRFWEDLLDTYRACGMNLAESHMNRHEERWSEAVRTRDMAPWDAMWWFWWNDEYLQAHPDHAAVTFEGEKDEKRICPEIMAGEDEEAISGLMESIVQNYRAGRIEGSWYDLEGPASFNICFCPRCISRFRDFADIPPDEDLTPAKIRAKYADEWVEMACRQTADVLERMKEYAADHDAEGWKLAVYSAVQNEHTRRSYRVDWPMIVPTIDVATPSFYSMNAGSLPTTFVQGNLEFQSVVRGVRDIPIWNTLTTGYGRGRPFTDDGRIVKMQVLKSVAFGADGTLQWWWGTNDGRHYQGYAQATSILATNE